MSTLTLEELELLVKARAESHDELSYTRRLIAAGAQRCAKKLGEEGVETALAISGGNSKEVCCEAADLLYHLVVGLHICGVTVEDVYAELHQRTAQTGLEEKASRSSS